MEGNKQGLGKRASSAKHRLHCAGMRHRQAKLVLRRVAGKGLRVEAKEGMELKRVAARLRKSGRMGLVGEGNYLGLGLKGLKKIEGMTIKGMFYSDSNKGGYSDGPGNHL